MSSQVKNHVKKTRILTDMNQTGHLKLVSELINNTTSIAASDRSSDKSSVLPQSNETNGTNSANNDKSNIIFMNPNTPPQIQKWGDLPDWAYSAARSILEALKKVDPDTYHHCVRVGEYSRLLAKAAGLNEYEQKIAEFSGLLHDIGKMGIPQEIVHKPAKLDEHEYLAMKNHSVYSEEIVRPLEKHSFFKQVNPCVRAHHERVDGQGYPDRLSGEEIPVISRVILVVDTMDAMGQDRAYRKGLPMDRIYSEIKKFSGTQFDSSLAKIFLDSHKYWSKESREPTTYQEIVLKVA